MSPLLSSLLSCYYRGRKFVGIHCYAFPRTIKKGETAPRLLQTRSQIKLYKGGDEIAIAQAGKIWRAPGAHATPPHTQHVQRRGTRAGARGVQASRLNRRSQRGQSHRSVIPGFLIIIYVRIIQLWGINAAQPIEPGSLPGGGTRPRRWQARLSTPEQCTAPQTGRSTRPPP